MVAYHVTGFKGNYILGQIGLNTLLPIKNENTNWKHFLYLLGLFKINDLKYLGTEEICQKANTFMVPN